MTDPYAPPSTTEPALNHGPPRLQFREIFKAWEKLRLLYNLIMFVVGVIAIYISSNYSYISIIDLIPFIVLFAIFANICFFAGSLCELILRALTASRKPQPLRWILFSLGTTISIMPAITAMIDPLLFAI